MTKNRWLVLVLAAALITLGLSVAAYLRAPRLLEVSPAPASSNIAPLTPLRLTFSKQVPVDSAAQRITIEPARNGSFSWEGNTLIFTPSQPWPSGTSITVQVKAGIPSGQAFSLPLLRGQTWSFTTSQTLLAYLWPASGEADLYALDPLTGDVRQLTSTHNILDYAFSADGDQFFYSVQLPDLATALWRQRRGEVGQAVPAPETILECPQAACRSPKPAPDGNWLAYERTPTDAQGQPGITSVWLLSLADRSTRQVSQPNHTTLHPSWSPNGWLAFYEHERQGFVIQEPSGQEIGFLPIRTGEAGDWSPDGKAFAAGELGSETTSSLGTFSSSRLQVFDLAALGSGGEALATDLTRAINLEDVSPLFSPDGEWIAFARRYLDRDRWTPGKQLWLIRPDGSAAHPLTAAGDYNHHDYAWSLDGKQLVFVRFNQTVLTEAAELWIIDSDGSHPIELVKGGYAPQWLP